VPNESEALATLSIALPFGRISSTKEKFLGITHPFAVGLNPLDLHVLGTPPAFILSQDQTLIRIVYNSEIQLKPEELYAKF
jgi:hypothetical protein